MASSQHSQQGQLPLSLRAATEPSNSTVGRAGGSINAGQLATWLSELVDHDADLLPSAAHSGTQAAMRAKAIDGVLGMVGTRAPSAGGAQQPMPPRAASYLDRAKRLMDGVDGSSMRRAPGL